MEVANVTLFYRCQCPELWNNWRIIRSCEAGIRRTYKSNNPIVSNTLRCFNGTICCTRPSASCEWIHGRTRCDLGATACQVPRHGWNAYSFACHFLDTCLHAAQQMAEAWQATRSETTSKLTKLWLMSARQNKTKEVRENPPGATTNPVTYILVSWLTPYSVLKNVR